MSPTPIAVSPLRFGTQAGSSDPLTAVKARYATLLSAKKPTSDLVLAQVKEQAQRQEELIGPTAQASCDFLRLTHFPTELQNVEALAQDSQSQRPWYHWTNTRLFKAVTAIRQEYNGLGELIQALPQSVEHARGVNRVASTNITVETINHAGQLIKVARDFGGLSASAFKKFILDLETALNRRPLTGLRAMWDGKPEQVTFPVVLPSLDDF